MPYDSSNDGSSYPEPGMEEDGVGSIHHLVGVFRRRIWIIATVLILVGVVGVIRAFRMSKTYEATARILVERHAPRLRQFESVVQDYSGWDPDFYTTQAQLVQSRAVLERACRRPEIQAMFQSATPAGAEEPTVRAKISRTLRAMMGATPTAPPEPWERLRGCITAEQAAESHFIEVRARSRDPVQAARLANAVAVAYEQFHLDRRRALQGDAFIFLNQEKDKQEQALFKAQEALLQFRESADGVSLTSADTDQPAMQRLANLNSRLTEVQLKRIELSAQIETLKHVQTSDSGAMAEGQPPPFPIVMNDPALAEVRRSLAQAKSEVAMLSRTYREEHPHLQAARALVAQILRRAGEALGQVIAAQAEQIEMLRQEERDLQLEYEVQRKSALSLAREMFTFAHLKGSVERHRRLLDMLVERVHQVDLSSGFVKTNVQVPDKATVPSSPVGPRRSRVVLTFLLAGLFFGVALALLVERIDDTVKSPDDIRRMHVPFMGFVPDIQPEDVTPDDEYVYRSTVMLGNTASVDAEAYRHIRTSLFASDTGGGGGVLVVTSASTGEGKTTTAVNLALAIAQSGKRVLLMDTDSHRPAVHRALALDNKEGLSDVLQERAMLKDVLQHLCRDGGTVDNLDVVVAGTKAKNPAELLGSPRMQALLETAKEDYDWVVLDTPPVLLISHAGILAGLCDGIIVVIRSGLHNRTLVTRALEYLQSVKAPLTGAILNQMVLSRFGRYYSNYYYHAYYYHYSKYYQAGSDSTGTTRPRGKRRARRSRIPQDAHELFLALVRGDERVLWDGLRRLWSRGTQMAQAAVSQAKAYLGDQRRRHWGGLKRLWLRGMRTARTLASNVKARLGTARKALREMRDTGGGKSVESDTDAAARGDDEAERSEKFPDR